MNDKNTIGMPRALVFAGLSLAIGLVFSAFVLGVQTKNIGTSKSSVSVKGLAEKKIQADFAEWQLSATATGASFPETLAKLRKEKIALDQFLGKLGFQSDVRRNQAENVEPRFVEKEIKGRIVSTQEGFSASQSVRIVSKDLELIASSSKAALDYKAEGHNIEFSSPSFLVSGLEEVKMSLISAATENAKKRAEEFTKHSDSKIANMRSASQGAFYILPDATDAKTDEYGGTYDKTSVDKIARVVVTVEFNLK